MSDGELQRRMLDGALALVLAAIRYGQHGCFAATCTDDTGKEWDIIVKPARIRIAPAASIIAPAPVTFSQN
jgi:hypothetical protein